MSTIGWTNERVDEVLVPVIKDLNRREAEGTQANITRFFGGGVGAGASAPRKSVEGGSKRLESALHKIGDRAKGKAVNGLEEVNGAATKANRRPATKRTKRAAASAATASENDEADDDDGEVAAPAKKARKGAKGRRKQVVDD